jgi:uncharacterized membrane protein
MTNTPTQRSAAEIRGIIRLNRWVLRLSRSWLIVVLVFLVVYVGLSLVAPVLMKAGYEGAADVIYTIYSPMCHQFAFRSWFLFGDQLVYPREAAGSSLASFEEYASSDPHFEGLDLYQWSSTLQLRARSFHGNQRMGYKTALCQRDVAIYTAMLLAGLCFIPLRRRLRPVPIWLYLFLGLVPIGLDGFSQLMSYPPLEFWPVRETLPGYRVLTGALFGIMNVWLAFPYLEMSMRETMEAIEAKLVVAEQRLAEAEAGE